MLKGQGYRRSPCAGFTPELTSELALRNAANNLEPHSAGLSGHELRRGYPDTVVRHGNRGVQGTLLNGDADIAPLPANEGVLVRVLYQLIDNDRNCLLYTSDAADE